MQGGIEIRAQIHQQGQTVRQRVGYLVRYQEGLQALLGALLGVEQSLPESRRIRRKQYFGGLQVLAGETQSRPSLLKPLETGHRRRAFPPSVR